ncbi:MAG: hypothetical protein IJ371_02920 [Clostridia bacterium]|nr:hypothetical protein [Clostridia bacterium]
MKFFKLVEIDEEEYIEKTRDLDFDCYSQSAVKANAVYPEDKNIYIAIDEDEEEIRINRYDFDDEEE